MTALTNIFIERLWRSLKCEEVYLKDYGMVPEARQELARRSITASGFTKHWAIGPRRLSTRETEAEPSQGGPFRSSARAERRGDTGRKEAKGAHHGGRRKAKTKQMQKERKNDDETSLI